MMQAYKTVQDIATQLGVKEETVRRWLRNGKLKGSSFGRAGYRINESDFETFLNGHNGSARSSNYTQHLLHLSTALADASSSSQVAELVLQHTLVAIHANVGVVATLNEDKIAFTNMRVIGYPQKVIDNWTEYPFDVSIPIADAVRESTILVIETLAERNQRYPHLAYVQAPGGDGALIALPLLTRGQAKGGLCFSFPEDRIFNQKDRDFLLTIGHLCAQGLERVLVEQKYQQAEDALKRSEARLRLALNNTTISVYQQDLELRYTWIYNPLPAFTSEGIIGKTDADFVLPEEASRLMEIKRQVIESEKGARVELKTTSDAGVRFHDLTMEPMRDNRGYIIGIIGASIDITERAELEQRKDEFISMASHELKTPLTSIKGFTQILHNRLNKQGDEQVLHFVAKMDGQLNKLTRLINELLDLSKIQTGEFPLQEEIFDLDILIQETIEMQQAATQTHHLRLDGLLHTQVRGDRDRIGQVLINLLSNAIKYSPEADKVIIRVWAEPEIAGVSVQDFGIGIAEHHHKQVFERFYQVTDPLEKTFPGLGIGLHISNEIIKRHHGHLWVESKKGEGATFAFTLPLSSINGPSSN